MKQDFTKEIGKYVYGQSDEHFSSDFFNTKEEAIEDAKHGYFNDIVYVGKVGIPTVSIYACNVLENIGEQLSDEVGEVAENFSWDYEEEKKVQEILDKALIEILKVVPLDCYMVEDVEQIKL